MALKFSPDYYLSTTVEYPVQKFSPTGYKIFTRWGRAQHPRRRGLAPGPTSGATPVRIVTLSGQRRFKLPSNSLLFIDFPSCMHNAYAYERTHNHLMKAMYGPGDPTDTMKVNCPPNNVAREFGKGVSSLALRVFVI
ncbi:hypothetical protein AVEN_6457-1 [Araneus ventricosus]|uniref:Uncharacterized protein n=1 Tax=Araneus ventricosus TaxID=182803 RepID=A0A4Y2SLB2_ARAVE|nr:hypothetical protein AVEN_6457-1 [Araneus ventricosus]